MNSAAQGGTARKFAIVLAGLGLFAIFASSFVYRMKHPSLTVEHREQHAEQSREMPGGAEIGMLMAKLKDNPADVESLRHLGEIFESMNAFDRAATFWKRLQGILPDDLQAINGLGIALFNLGDFKGAAEQFQNYLRVDPKNAPAHYNLGLINRHEFKDEKAAVEHFKAAKALKWGDPELDRRLDEELAR